MHNLKHFKDTKDKETLKVMSKIRRKAIALCRLCNGKVHGGKYDGMSLKELGNQASSLRGGGGIV
jgi:hypothetical protein